MRILWIGRCDPRESLLVCDDAREREYLQPLFAIVRRLQATITFTAPTTLDAIQPYDVVITNFCSVGLQPATIRILDPYLAAGGSVVVMGDNFCQSGVANVPAMSSQLASVVTQKYGIDFSDDDDMTNRVASAISDHPLTNGVRQLFSFRHAYLQVQRPAQTIVTIEGHPFIAVLDAAGTLVAIPDTTFHWDPALFGRETKPNDNAVFWPNLLRWLAGQSQHKRAHLDRAVTSMPPHI
jgi:hypothetical protein